MTTMRILLMCFVGLLLFGAGLVLVIELTEIEHHRIERRVKELEERIKKQKEKSDRQLKRMEELKDAERNWDNAH
jgi:hypothetical protein